MKISILIICLVCFNSSTIAEPFTLTGKILNNSENITSVSLYKKHNNYYKEFVSNIPVIENEFIYLNKDINETDVYVIRNSKNNQFIQFIWNGDTRVVIDSVSNFYRAKIINSPLDDEFTKFDSLMQDSLFEPIRRLDRIIIKQNKTCPTGCDSLDTLIQLRTHAEKFARENQTLLKMNYVRSNPSSFVSLFLLTLTGTESNIEEYRKHFNLLSDELKQHSRAKQYTD